MKKPLPPINRSSQTHTRNLRPTNYTNTQPPQVNGAGYNGVRATANHHYSPHLNNGSGYNQYNTYNPKKTSNSIKNNKHDSKLKYFNIFLGAVLMLMVGKVVAPDANLNPIALLSQNGLDGLSIDTNNSRMIGFEVNVKSVIDNIFIQKSIKGIPGAIIVTDANLNMIAGQGADTPMEPASILKLITAEAFFNKFDPADKPLGGITALEYAKDMLNRSDNVMAEKMAELVGLKAIETRVREITGNSKLPFTNGSGCNKGSFGDDPHGCTGGGSRATIKITPREMVSMVSQLDKTLAMRKLTMKDLLGTPNTPGASGRRYKPDLASINDPQVFGKTGTLESDDTFSFAGMMINENGEKLFFTFINQGNGDFVVGRQGDALKSTYQGRAK